MSPYKLCVASLLAALCGCGQAPHEQPVTPTSAITPTAAASRYFLADEPDEPIGVVELRGDAHDGDRVVVVGRVGGGVNPWVTGKAAFVLVDSSASAECEDGCEDPNCNCHAIELADSIVVVKFVDPSGRVLATPAQSLLGLEALETVVVEGTAKRDKAGNLSLVAEGIYIRR